MRDALTPGEARRIVLAAQGFGPARPGVPDAGHLKRLASRLGFFQIDSVNVLVRAHYMPAFSRLGAYDQGLIDRASWGRPGARAFFEYWGHEASLLPLASHALFRWRMEEADRGETGWSGLRPFATERRAEAMGLLARLRADGPLSASELERGRTGWWVWSEAKSILEWLFWAGHVTTRVRRGSFERVYDLPERVLPSEILALPTPSPDEARAALVDRAASALGIATAAEIRDYFRLRPADAGTAIRRLRDEGVLLPVAVPGSPPLLRHRDSRLVRRTGTHALLAPFDPLIADRTRTERLFGFRYRIEMYTPAARRVHGYYVLPFLLDDRLVARVDLKSDRAGRRLVVRSVHLEPGSGADTPDALRAALDRLASWLGLDAVTGLTSAFPPGC